MIAAIPLLASDRSDAVVAYRGGRPIPAAAFLGDVEAAAARLPRGGYVMNLCTDRYRFAVGLGAALVRGVVTLLPQSLAPEALRRLAAAYGNARALVDPAAPMPSPVETVAIELDRPSQCAQVPAFDPGQLAVIAFTSGSTGLPQPQAKTWGSLADGARAEAAALGLAAGRACTLVGTVPAQHMYGLESTLLLALHNGLAWHAARPLYPADVRVALEQVDGARVLVTTPVHLRALLADDIALPPLELVVCATAPLPVVMARQVEARYDVVLREIYGFTEAGMVAVRRTSRETAWRTLPGVGVRRVADAVYFHGGHVQREVPAGDLLEVLDAHTFKLHGRAADTINVAGKRSSLAHLNHALSCIDGVVDSAFFMPEQAAGAAVARPVAFAVAPGRTREQLLAGLRERIDPVFLPRPLHLVDALPRNATGKLTREALAALAASLASTASARGEQAEVPIQPDDPVALGHFPDHPVVPAAVILDQVMRRAEAKSGLPPGAWTIPAAKFLAPLRPGEALRIDLQSGGGGEVQFTCSSGARTIASGTLRRQPAADPG